MSINLRRGDYKCYHIAYFRVWITYLPVYWQCCKVPCQQIFRSRAPTATEEILWILRCQLLNHSMLPCTRHRYRFRRWYGSSMIASCFLSHVPLSIVSVDGRSSSTVTSGTGRRNIVLTSVATGSSSVADGKRLRRVSPAPRDSMTCLYRLSWDLVAFRLQECKT